MNGDDTVKIVMREWEETILPGELAADSVFLNELMRILDRKGRKIFELKLKLDGKVAVKAQGYVGIFTLRDSRSREIILIVEPKISVKSLTWMLALSQAKSFKEVRELENLIAPPPGSQSVLDLLIIGVIEKYMEKLSEALAYGFVEVPVIHSEEGVVIRGRIITSSIARTYVMSSSPMLAYEVQRYTIDNPVNQYILEAGYALISKIYNLFKVINVDISTLSKAILELDYYPSTSTRNISILDMLRMIPLDRPYLAELLKLSIIIHKWIEGGEAPYPGGLVKVPALYIIMNNLFENFVRKMFIIAASYLRRRKGIQVVVTKAGKRKQALIISPKPAVFLEPDIVIHVNKKPIAVGDVKYKLVRNPLKSGPNGDRKSVNQAYTYMHGWGVEKGFLVYPSDRSKSYYETYRLKDGKRLYIFRIYIDETALSFKELKTTRLFNVFLAFLDELLNDHRTEGSNDAR